MPTTALYLTGAALVVLLGGRMLYGMVKLQGPRRVALLGDSLTGGPGYAAGLEPLLTNRSVVKAYSYPGKGSAFIRNRVFDVFTWAPTDIVVLAGVNDLAAGRPASDVIENLQNVYTEARAHGVRVVAVLLTPWSGHFRGASCSADTDAVNRWIQYQARDVDAVVRTDDLGDSSSRLKSWYDSGDGLHLNAEGQEMLARLVSKAF